MDDLAIRALLGRLARPHPSGGKVIERSAILAEGADFPAVMAWITAHAGTPETMVAHPAAGGLHGPRVTEEADRAPNRYVLPVDALS